MKICTTCNENKSENEFYLDSRSKIGRRETTCKQCRKTRGSQTRLTKPKTRYKISKVGNKFCITCRTNKIVTEFRVNRALVGGRQPWCKPCHSTQLQLGRRAKGPIYSVSRWPTSELDTNYISHKCEICNNDFLPMRPTHKRCETCSCLVRDIQSHLSSRKNTNNVLLKCSVVHATIITKRHVQAQQCCYCDRSFTAGNKKSIDHITPICLGGTNDPSNINICCLECNRSKAWLPLDKWIALCQAVVKSQIVDTVDWYEGE